METMTPWLLLLIAALIVACVSLFFQLRQEESQSRGRELMVSDELRDAEAALLSALERVRKMDRSLAAREHDLAEQHRPPPPAPQHRPAMAVAVRPRAIVVTRSRSSDAPRQAARPAERKQVDAAAGKARDVRSASGAAPPAAPWRIHALELARSGRTPVQIARALELPVGQVELVIALQSRRGASS